MSDPPFQQRRQMSGPQVEPKTLSEMERVQQSHRYSHGRNRDSGNINTKRPQEETEPSSIEKVVSQSSSGRYADSEEDVDTLGRVKLSKRHGTEHRKDQAAGNDRPERFSKSKVDNYREPLHKKNAENVSGQGNDMESNPSVNPAWADTHSRHHFKSRDAALSSLDHGVQTELNTWSRGQTMQPSSVEARHLKIERTEDNQGPPIKASRTNDKRQSSQGMTTASGSRSAAPNFDAPVSAVNTGQRNVTVKSGRSTISIPITPTTTTTDVLDFAGNLLSGAISSKTSVLLESYKELGLERPLRKYEHIRDVLNSWDNDLQNVLLVEPSPTEGSDEDLDIRSITRGQPAETSVLIHHSQKPGKWDKRWVTLRSDGQVLISKSNNAESVNICHMSDFDIYIPTSRQLKKIKSPKKICFAVKSQQKTSMFLSTANFVHFFSTKDKETARAWYKAVQEWRSWYLVRVMGEGQKQSQHTDFVLPEHLRSGIPLEVRPQSKSSAESHSYRNTTLSSSIPPGATGHVGKSQHTTHLAGVLQPGGPAKLESSRSFERSLGKGGPDKVSFARKLTKNAPAGLQTIGKSNPTIIRGIVHDIPVMETFDANGLLGKTYEQRHEAQHKGEADGNQISRPVRAHTVRNSPSYKATSSTHATKYRPENGGSQYPGQEERIDILKRISTKRQTAKPLIDLTPKYQEPPQHSRKGKGLVPDILPPGGLIDIATTPEIAIMLPPTTTFRRPDHPDVQPIQRTKTLRGTTTKPSRLTDHKARFKAEADEVINGGLLSKSSKGQGESSHGKGVATGDRHANGPLLDISRPSEYIPGSLLAEVERRHSGDEQAV